MFARIEANRLCADLLTPQAKSRSLKVGVGTRGGGRVGGNGEGKEEGKVEKRVRQLYVVFQIQLKDFN